ncbi:MAG: hypothetical protein JXQ27_09215 [Acidobacteria bacterium]|nr:hypothetical protein [Acidobacteriota bacterium]
MAHRLGPVLSALSGTGVLICPGPLDYNIPTGTKTSLAKEFMDPGQWRPKKRSDCDVRRLTLDEAEGYVLFQLDGQTSLQELTYLTGFPLERIARIVARLAVQGAIEKEPPEFPSADPAAAPDATTSQRRAEPPAVGEAAAGYAGPTTPDTDEAGIVPPFPEETDDPELMSDESMADELAEIFAAPEEPGGTGTAQEDMTPEKEADEAAAVRPAVTESEEEAAAGEADALNFRRLFEEKLSRLPVEQRRVLAARAADPALAALCFDADPGVIRGVLSNPAAELRHARLVARHHRNPVGLSVVSGKYLQDDQVQRGLLRNNQASDTLLQKLMNVKPMQLIYQLCVSRELSERAKYMARLVFRRKFQQGAAEECAAIIVNTAGRCLLLLTGLGLDSGTALLLCRRNLSSTQLVQNLARFAGTPPALIQHLFRQPLVRRNFNIKRLLLQHPNCPSQLKE